jgi:hypothetical protein
MFNEDNNLNIQQKPTETQDQFIERLKSEHFRIVSDLRSRLYQNERHYRELQKEFEKLPSGTVKTTQMELPSPRYEVKTYNVIEKVYKCSIDRMSFERLSDTEKYEVLQQMITAEIVKDKGLPIEVKIDSQLGIAVLRVTFANDISKNFEPKINYFNP